MNSRSLIILAATAVAGCSTWTINPAGKSLLQPARMSPDSVVVEFALLDLAKAKPERTAELWRVVDEQLIPLETRQRLAKQGFRCGVVGSQLPSWITDHLTDQGNRLELDETKQTAVVSDLVTERRIQCRAGQRRSFPVGLRHKKLVVGSSGPDSDAPQEYADAQCHLGLTVTPKGDGQTELELVPEIQHGALHQRWLGQDGAFRLDASRDAVRYEELKICASLVPGQTLVLAALPGAEGIGKVFGGNNGGDAPPAGKLVLLRLAQTQFDDLFSPPQSLTPIATQPP